jgi:hypothetical protein
MLVDVGRYGFFAIGRIDEKALIVLRSDAAAAAGSLARNSALKPVLLEAVSTSQAAAPVAAPASPARVEQLDFIAPYGLASRAILNCAWPIYFGN